MKLITFIFINFIVSFLSDIILNDLSTNFGFITSLKPYFNKESIIKSGIFAAITVEIALFITIIFSYLLFGFLFPINNKNLLYFCILAFLIGYVIDIIIYKFKLIRIFLIIFSKPFLNYCKKIKNKKMTTPPGERRAGAAGSEYLSLLIS
jgi:hypothetical protein